MDWIRLTLTLYLRFDDSKIVESEEVSPGVVLDFNEANEVVGIEMLHLSKRSKAPAMDFVQLEGVPAAQCQSTKGLGLTNGNR